MLSLKTSVVSTTQINYDEYVNYENHPTLFLFFVRFLKGNFQNICKINRVNHISFKMTNSFNHTIFNGEVYLVSTRVYKSL